MENIFAIKEWRPLAFPESASAQRTMTSIYLSVMEGPRLFFEFCEFVGMLLALGAIGYPLRLAAGPVGRRN